MKQGLHYKFLDIPSYSGCSQATLTEDSITESFIFAPNSQYQPNSNNK